MRKLESDRLQIFEQALDKRGQESKVKMIVKMKQMKNTLSFNEILEEIEALPEEDQVVLIDLIQRRLIERRRTEIVANIAEAKQAYQQGKAFRGSVDDVIAELNN